MAECVSGMTRHYVLPICIRHNSSRSRSFYPHSSHNRRHQHHTSRRLSQTIRVWHPSKPAAKKTTRLCHIVCTFGSYSKYKYHGRAIEDECLSLIWPMHPLELFDASHNTPNFLRHSWLFLEGLVSQGCSFSFYFRWKSLDDSRKFILKILGWLYKSILYRWFR